MTAQMSGHARLATFGALAALLAAGVAAASATDNELLTDEANVVAVEQNDVGRWMTAEGIPTFHIEDDGTVDWSTFSGFRRYHAECHVCHGPDGMGSTYAPALAESAKNLDYYEFVGVVVNGRNVEHADANSVMPSFGTNPNVMCYLDDIYVYLKARGVGELDRGRPAKKVRKTEAFSDAEDVCLGL